jgi:hypothetical protein
MNCTKARFVLVGLFLMQGIASAAATPGAQLTGWRHDGATGYWPGKGFPTKWSEQENLRWKVAMPGMSIALPIVVGGRVFTIAEPYALIAVDIASGKIEWQAEVNPFELIEDPGLTLAEGAELLARLNSLKAAYGPTYGGRMLQGVDEAAARRRLALFLQRIKGAAALMPGFDVASIDVDLTNVSGKGGVGAVKKPWMALKRAFYDRYAFHPDNNCQLHLGMACATPVTDGRCVCVAFGSGQVACYDLDGRRRWARLFRLPGREDGFQFTAFHGAELRVLTTDRYYTGSGNYVSHMSSPVIADGKLILWHHYRFHALDLATGKTVWEHLGPEGSCTALTVLRIAPDDTAVVVTAGGTVVRVDDGEVLAVGLRNDRGSRRTYGGLADDPSKWPGGAVDGSIISREGAESGWHSPTADGRDVIFVQKNNGNGPGPHSAVRLSLDENGKLMFDELWETDGSFKQTNPTALYHAGLLYIPDGRGVRVLDAASGETMNHVKVDVGTSLAAADRYLVVTSGGSRDNWAKCSFSLFALGRELAPAGSGSLVSDLRVPYGVRQHFPEYLDWWGGVNKKYHHLSNPVMYGDKVFYRSMTHLYCWRKGR